MAEVYPGLGDWLATSPEIDLGPALDEVAAKVEQRAQGIAAAHSDTGEFAGSIRTEVDHSSPSGRDRVVFSDHPAAAAIEWGHVAPDGTHVEGLHVFAQAADTP